MGSPSYFGIGAVLGLITAFVVFVGSWIYCIAHYGFLLGVGLGWLPSGIVAALAGVAMMLLWGLLALAIVAIIVTIIVQQ